MRNFIIAILILMYLIVGLVAAWAPVEQATPNILASIILICSASVLLAIVTGEK